MWPEESDRVGESRGEAVGQHGPREAGPCKAPQNVDLILSTAGSRWRALRK